MAFGIIIDSGSFHQQHPAAEAAAAAAGFVVCSSTVERDLMFRWLSTALRSLRTVRLNFGWGVD